MGVMTKPDLQPTDRIVRNYAERPLLVYWEMTQACRLACRHCRAEAIPSPQPGELNQAEGRALLEQIAAFGAPLPHLILTGGDPLERADLFDLIDAANALGLSVSMTPAATEKLTQEVMVKLKTHGIRSLGLSLDGSDAARHEAVRGVRGCFDWTIRAARIAAELDLPVQINTLVAAETADDLPAVFDLLKTHQVMRWSLFFLIAVGRGRVLQEVSPGRAEALMNWAYDLSHIAPFEIKTTEAPFYRRVALSRMQGERMWSDHIKRTSVYRGFGIRDGHGIMFVSSTGDIYPSGFLPMAAGNVRTSRVAEVYRNAPLFRKLHNPGQFSGKCGSCEYRIVCGGSRARAFAYTGDPLESDPLCPYQAKG
jgi:radical SAM protein